MTACTTSEIHGRRLPKRRLRVAIAAGFASLSLFGSTASAYLTPLWARPEDTIAAAANRSTVQVFDVFSDDDSSMPSVQDLAPDAVDINPNGHAALYDRRPFGSIITSTGNLYSPIGQLDLKIHVPGYAPISGAKTSFLVQIRTEGQELLRTNDSPPTYDFSNFAINGTPLTSLREFTYSEPYRLFVSDDLGSNVEHAFLFTLPTTVAAGYDFTYKPLEAHTSQVAIIIDTFTRIAGDFDWDGDRDALDLDLLLRTTGNQPLFDVNDNGSTLTTPRVAGSDTDAWVIGLAQSAYGDADLDRDVDFDDLLTLARNYGKAEPHWAAGDFDGSGSVNFDDLLTLARNYGHRPTGGLSASVNFEEDWALAQSLVPEPTFALGGLVLGTLAVRRRQTTKPE